MTNEASPLALSTVRSTTSSRSRDSSGVHLARRSSKFSHTRHSTAGSPHQHKQRVHDVNGGFPASQRKSKPRPSIVPSTNGSSSIKPTASNRRSPSVEEIEEVGTFQSHKTASFTAQKSEVQARSPST
jgi:hypothetical protein